MSHQLEKANRIIQTSNWPGTSHGELIVKTLLEGRTFQELDIDELRALAKGYNWWGKHQEEYEAIISALKRQPANLPLAEEAVIPILNAHRIVGRLLQTYDKLIADQLGPAWFWRIRKAIEYELTATGEREMDGPDWQPGMGIPHPDLLEQAMDELFHAIEAKEKQAWDAVQQHLACRPALRESPRFDMLKTRLTFKSS